MDENQWESGGRRWWLGHNLKCCQKEPLSAKSIDGNLVLGCPLTELSSKKIRRQKFKFSK